MASRARLTGKLVVGLVNVPIRLYTATRTEGIACHDRCRSRSKTNATVPSAAWWCQDENVRITAASGDGPRPPGGDRTAAAGHDGVVAETPLDLADEHLWLHQRVGSGGARHSSIPFGAASRKPYSTCGSAAAAAAAGYAAVAHKADLNGIAQSDVHGIELDLHAARLTGFQMNSMYGNDVPTIKRVSHYSIVSCDRRVPRSPMDPLVSDV
jgi:hypothetical protein